MAKNGDFSPGTKALIDRMMKEKKISFRQQKQITRAMSVGQALPVEGPYFELEILLFFLFWDRITN